MIGRFSPKDSEISDRSSFCVGNLLAKSGKSEALTKKGFFDILNDVRSFYNDLLDATATVF